MFKIVQKNGEIKPLTDRKLIDALIRDTRVFTLITGEYNAPKVKDEPDKPAPKVVDEPEVKEDPLAKARAAKAAKRAKQKAEAAELKAAI